MAEKPEPRAAERDEVLKRMLKMPPKPHKPMRATPRAKKAAKKSEKKAR